MTKSRYYFRIPRSRKTTFIKKLPSDVWAGEKLVLIENEFGEIGIDGGFLKRWQESRLQR